MAKRARELEKNGELTRREVAKMLGVSERTMFRGLKAARDHDEFVGGAGR
jgi:DNA-binding transcriptional regulator LsrR (DeoR family)